MLKNRSRRRALTGALALAAVATIPRETRAAGRRQTDWPRLYAGSGSIVVPASAFATHRNSAALCGTLYNLACAASPGNLNAFDRQYTYPIFLRQQATRQYSVMSQYGNMRGRQIWWSPDWNAPSGTDNQIIWYDLQTGAEINAWRVSVDHSRRIINALRMNRVNLEQSEALLGTIKSFISGNGRFRPSRGCGIAYGAMLTLPEEIDAGIIRHALSVPCKSTKNVYVSPATKSDGSASGTIPKASVSRLLQPTAK